MKNLNQNYTKNRISGQLILVVLVASLVFQACTDSSNLTNTGEIEIVDSQISDDLIIKIDTLKFEQLSNKLMQMYGDSIVEPMIEYIDHKNDLLSFKNQDEFEIYASMIAMEHILKNKPLKISANLKHSFVLELLSPEEASLLDNDGNIIINNHLVHFGSEIYSETNLETQEKTIENINIFERLTEKIDSDNPNDINIMSYDTTNGIQIFDYNGDLRFVRVVYGNESIGGVLRNSYAITAININGVTVHPNNENFYKIMFPIAEQEVEMYTRYRVWGRCRNRTVNSSGLLYATARSGRCSGVNVSSHHLSSLDNIQILSAYSN